MARRILRRTLDSKFKIGQSVTVAAHYNGDYHGEVIATHRHLHLVTDSRTEETANLPGVTVRVTRWEGLDYDGEKDSPFAPFDICAHDNSVTTRPYTK